MIQVAFNRYSSKLFSSQLHIIKKGMSNFSDARDAVKIVDSLFKSCFLEVIPRRLRLFSPCARTLNHHLRALRAPL